MAKRGATSELNHDNWDREEEPEDSGTFTRASDDQLKARVIKTARRRNLDSSANNGDEPKKNAFSAFKGFGSANANAASPAAPNFSFLSNLTAPKTNGTAEKSTPFSLPTTATKESSDGKKEYYAKLKGLNESVSKWITKHVNENPLIDLEPVFKDYRKYIQELEADSKPATNNGATDSTTNKPEPEKKPAALPTFSFGAPAITSTTGIGFSFGSAKPTFSFGSMSNGPKGSESLSFGSTVSTVSSTSSFGGLATPAVEASKPEESKNGGGEAAGGDDEDEPPKVEYNPAMEDDHIYTKKCKMFLKKGGSFGAGSVGNLFLKNVDGSSKVQFILRADNHLGNVLCNFILAEGVPIQRMNKNNVLMVCSPLPNAEPTSVLLRVKTAEDADELYETLKKHQK